MKLPYVNHITIAFRNGFFNIDLDKNPAAWYLLKMDLQKGVFRMNKCVFFDHAAATEPDPEVLEYFAAESRTHYANSEAVNILAYRARTALANAAEKLSLTLTGNKNSPVIWGNSATELFKVAASLPEFSTSWGTALEHPALTANLKNFTSYRQIPVTKETLPDFPENDFKAKLGVLFQVQSELGIIQDTGKLFPAGSAEALLTDAVQAAGKIPLDKNSDILIISGVKFGSPGGAAMLLAPDGKFTAKLLEHAEKMRKKDYALSRISVPMMLAMTFAAEKAVSQMNETFKKVSELNSLIRNGAAELGIGTTLSDSIPVSPYILNLLLPDQEAAVVVRALGERGIYAAAGSACSAESGQPSAALTALGIRGKRSFRALRLSFWKNNTVEDGEFFISELKNVLKNY